MSWENKYKVKCRECGYEGAYNLTRKDLFGFFIVAKSFKGTKEENYLLIEEFNSGDLGIECICGSSSIEILE